MTLVAQGIAEEVRGQGVAANALWPATLLESQATIRWGLGDRSLWRKPDIVADAMVAIFSKPPDALTGQSLIDEDFLRSEGVTDFARYRCDPDKEPPRVGFDFRFQAG
jgi:citronellol/citronellal dehydrogenase